MCAYITAAPPGTAIHYAQCESWGLADHLAAETLFELRKLGWRYGAVHFVDGGKVPYPERIDRPGIEKPETYDGPTWETATVDELISPEVRALLRGA